MATAQRIVIAGPSNTRLYAGKFGPANLTGNSLLGVLASAGELASISATLSGSSVFGDLSSTGDLGVNSATILSGSSLLGDLLSSGTLASVVPFVLSGTSLLGDLSSSGSIQGFVESGAFVSNLAVRETAGAAGAVPYSATVLPLKGQVPSGQTLISPDDASLRSSILSTHDDGSAAVVVVAGSTAVTANQAKSLRLMTASSATGTNLTTAAIAAAVTSVVVNFQGTYGSATLNSFGSPERTWWANPQVICARYRLAAPTPGTTALEAVIDIHAYSGGRALVEVVIENGKMTSSSPSKPAAATYTGATVTVNGTTVSTVNSNGPTSAEGNHAAFRAWYSRTWVGGDPGVRVTQDVKDLQKHPLLWAMDRPSTADFTAYGSDAYTAWTTGRQRGTGMGGTGDHPSIGPLPQWEAQAIQSGDHRAWNAVEVSALAALSYNINYRDTVTGLVPTFSAIGTRSQASGTWPNQTNGSDAAMWETAHAPDVGLVAFLSRPSPVFIEIAQKAAFWNGTWSSDNTAGWSPGLFGYWFQIRGRAWGIRSVTHAAFITPSALPWRAAAVTALANNVTYLSNWSANANHSLNTITDYTPTTPRDFETGITGFQNSVWQHHYLTSVLHRMSSSGLLTGASGTAANALADWMATQPVRWVNEQPGGGWRYIGYETTMGSDSTGTTINSAADWGAEMSRAGNHNGVPASVSGSWMGNGGLGTSYASGYSAHLSANAYYPTYLYDALVVANERGIVGAPKAWYTVDQNITNFNTWKSGFGTDPRWGSRPRSVTGSGADTSSWDGGQGAAYKGLETFTALQGVYNGISSSGGWAQLPGTNMQTVVPSNAILDAISPNPVLRQGEQDLFIRIWGSACWNGYGWFFVVPGGHFAGYRNDTYNIRLADPVGPVRMHLPSPIAAVYGRPEHPTSPNALIAKNLWASQSESNIASIPDWGPRGCHQYASMVWDAATEQMVMAGDSQQYALNLTDIGQSPQAFSAVYIFNPYAPTPKKAWTRLRTGTTGANIEGGMNNGDGTVSYRVHNTAELFTVNLATRQVTPGAVLASPSATQYQSWRHSVRDPATGFTYELAGQTWNADVTNFALWRTSGGLQKIANLPASCWTGSPYQDEQSTIVIHNGKAYVCFQTGPGTSSGDGDTNATVQLGVHQINLSTGAVQSFTTSPNMPVPDTLYAGNSLNGLNGRFSFVPQVGAFVVMLSARANVWVFRPPSSWSV